MYKKNTNIIISELKNILLSVPTKQTRRLVKEIIIAEKVFIIAIGRVSLALQCFGKRLSHLGIQVELVGSLTEKPATKKDLLIVASSSGESLVPVEISKKAKKIGCKIIHITSAKKSTIRKLSNNNVVELKAPFKKIKSNNEKALSLFDSTSKTNKSIQPMSTLFDQALHIYGDIVALELIKELKINFKKLGEKHANLE